MTTGPLSVRPARADDPAEVDRIYDICLRTAAAGKDATGRFAEPRLVGDVFAGPYLAHSPDLAWVLAPGGAEGPPSPPVGYFLAVADTESFERDLEDAWWPRLRTRRAHRPVEPDTPDAWLRAHIDDPPPTPTDITARYPAHFHVDLLPEAQGGGNGRRLMSTAIDALRARGVPGVHLGVSTRNTNAIGFYTHVGFHVLLDGPDSKILGMPLS
ncbi:GNAT family N-acetyltransferase [Actinomadura sp. WMMB 499]|uniref:GNAT family N-acetyltransferase n=1 Tax=Actinomadura sp. WMMB 499 TaxID=1219491 RepID=UPI001248DE61|nr:GNAT family N-acetyltransferase [Actinomadura sp. WMMB 499]QFG21891.1 GNAT family N-acetyltransferase [Actinomadura sp. WMMB 499]